MKVIDVQEGNFLKNILKKVLETAAVTRLAEPIPDSFKDKDVSIRFHFCNPYQIIYPTNIKYQTMQNSSNEMHRVGGNAEADSFISEAALRSDLRLS